MHVIFKARYTCSYCLIILFVSEVVFGDAVQNAYMDGQTVVIQLTGNTVRLTAANAYAVEVAHTPSGDPGEATWLVDPDMQYTGSFTSVNLGGDPIVLASDNYELLIFRNPYRLEFRNRSGTTLFNCSNMSLSYLNAQVISGDYYGVRNRVIFGWDNGEPALPSSAIDSLRFPNGATFSIKPGQQGDSSTPLIWTTNGFGIISDSEVGTFHQDGTSLTIDRNNDPSGRSCKRQSHVIYLLSGSPRQIMKGFYDITGHFDLPPLWVLGFIDCEWGNSQSEALSDLNEYRSRGIPLDAFMLDFEWMEWGTGDYGEWRWGGGNFPDGPSGVFKDTCLAQGVKLMGIRKPRIHQDTSQGQYANSQGWVNGAGTDYLSGKPIFTLDFTIPEANQWFWNNFINNPYQNTYEKGIIAYWNDEGEYGNPYNFLCWQLGQYEGQRQYNNNRVFSLNRQYEGGAHRYAYTVWSGDPHSNWDMMADQPLAMLTSVVLGASWWSMDVSGFHGPPGDELYYRWMQMGAFVPVFRIHGRITEKEREPWFYSAQAESLSKSIIEFRYQLLPYTYNAYWQLHEHALPICRPLAMDWPSDQNVADTFEAWMFGQSLLVNPIAAPEVSSKSIYLPAGQWLDFWTDEEHAGGGSINIPVSPSTVPVYVRRGAIIPMRPVAQHVEDGAGLERISFHIYGDGSDSFDYYEDDGTTYNYENGDYCKITYTHSTPVNYQVIDISSQEGTYTPVNRPGYFVFHAVSEEPSGVSFNYNPVNYVSPSQIENISGDGWAYDVTNNHMIVRLADPFAEGTLRVSFIDVNPPDNLQTLAGTLPLRVELNWQDNSDNEDGFYIQRKPYQGIDDWHVIGSTGANATNFTDTNNLCGLIEYTYRVGAFKN